MSHETGAITLQRKNQCIGWVLGAGRYCEPIQDCAELLDSAFVRLCTNATG